MAISQPPFQSTLVDANDRVQTPWAQWFSQLQPILQSVVASGPTSGRPTQNLYIGYPYFDTTIDQMVYWNGVIWVTYAPSTTGTNILKGNGSGGFNNAIAGVDFAPATSGNAILYGNGAGGFSSVSIGSGVTFAGGVLSATGSGGTVTSVTGTAPITSSGGNTPAISISQAGVSTNGYLSSTDWNTFNNKAPATSGTAILYGNGTGGFSNVTIGSGVTFVAGTLSATGSGGTVTAVTGTAPVVSSGGTAPAISMAAATATVNGYLTSTDWNIFNNKGSGTVTFVGGTGSVNGITLTGTVTTSGNLTLGGTLGSIANSQLINSSITINGTAVSLGGSTSVGTVTGVTGTAPVVSSGGTAPAISMAAATTSVSGYLTSTDWTTFNNKSNTNGTVTSVAAITLGTTGTDLSSTVATGTTTPVITLQVPTASAANRGALSSTDWTTFNNKQPAGAYLTASTGVTTFNGGTTGLTPATATSGAITLAGILIGANGGTGVANTGKTFTIDGNFTTSGAFTTTLTVTANTALTLPISGTVLSSVTAPTTNPITGTPSASNYLRGDGTWATFTTGTVTSVGFTGGLITVATPTTTPTFTVAGTSGGIPYFSSASTWATSAALTANALMIGGGAGSAPATTTTGTGVLTALGTNVGAAGAFVTFNGALGTPSSGTVTNLTGTASININGTVGATTANTGAFTNLSYTGTLTGGTGVIAIGTNQIYKDASGNVGVGTSSPANKLDVLGGRVVNRSSGTTSSAWIEAQVNDYWSASTYTGTSIYQNDHTTTGTTAGLANANLGVLNFQNGSGALILTNTGTPIVFANSAVEHMRIDASGNVLVTSPAGLGYGTGSGGTVTQATNKSTGVTLNKPTGQITMNAAALLPATQVVFTLTNSLLTIYDVVVVNMDGFSGASDYYNIWAAPITGGAYIFVKNISAGSLSEAIRIHFAIIKGASS